MTAVGAETSVIDDWLENVLSTDSTISALCGDRIYADAAPIQIVADGDEVFPTYPFIVYQCMVPEDVFGMGPRARIMSKATYIVRGIAEGTYDSLKPVAAAIDEVIEGMTGTTADGLVLGVQRQEPYRMTENHEGRLIRHLGGTYLILAKGT